MASINGMKKKAKAATREEEAAQEQLEAPSNAAGEVRQPAAPPTELTPEVADDSEAARLLASQANLHSLDPRTALQFPDNRDDNRDMPSSKDHLLNDHKIRIGNKRRFLTDALCRSLNCEGYLLEVDKAWAPNPLGKGANISVRYTREMIGVYVLFDKFDLEPTDAIVALKKKLANEHGYKYVYEKPSQALTHDVLHKMLEEQKGVVPAV